MNLTSGKLTYPQIDRLDSEVTKQGDMNSSTCELAHGLHDGAARAAIEGRLADARQSWDETRRGHGGPFRVWARSEHTKAGLAPKPFRGPVVALVDNDCASSCESFTQYVPQLEGGVLVGENTGGVGVFGELRSYRLPRSGLGMSAGKKHFHDADPTRIVPEGRGQLPDLWLDDDDTPALAARIAECLAKPGCPLREHAREERRRHGSGARGPR
jgi:hypothetical protein